MNDKVLMSTIQYALCVMLLCYLPHVMTAPKWLFILFLTAIIYKLIADYYAIPLLHKAIHFSLVVLCLVFLKLHYGSILSSGFFIGFLLTFIALKIIETHTVRDVKVLILCNFYLIFSALIVIQEVWIIFYLIIAVVANLSLMLKLSAPEASLRQIGKSSIKQLIIAIPLSILLFYLFPRIANPLWQVPSQNQSHTGFNERMNPGSIAELFKDDSIALRVTFKDKPIINGYWRGLLLTFYDGVSWNSAWYPKEQVPLLPELNSEEIADYEVLLEPHQKKWLFFSGYPAMGSPQLLFASNYGLVSQNKERIDQRFAYSLSLKPPPYEELTPKEIAQNTQLPRLLNPKIKTWASERFAKAQHNPEAFIHLLKKYINEQPFWYTLTPPRLNGIRDQIDFFWFDTQKGFCEHYASAITVILRSVGIPARIIIGYQGGEWNPVAHYMTLKQNDAHAWLEYWQPGIGWKAFDPTAFIAPERVDQNILDLQASRSNQELYNDSTNISWLMQTQLLFESTQFFAERWLLFYSQNTQHDLLEKIGIAQWTTEQLLQASIVCFILFILLLGIIYQWRQKKARDPLLREYHLLQHEFRRFKVPTPISASLQEQCRMLMTKLPNLSSEIALFLAHYEQLRLHVEGISAENKKETIKLFKKLRSLLKSEAG